MKLISGVLAMACLVSSSVGLASECPESALKVQYIPTTNIESASYAFDLNLLPPGSDLNKSGSIFYLSYTDLFTDKSKYTNDYAKHTPGKILFRAVFPFNGAWPDGIPVFSVARFNLDLDFFDFKSLKKIGLCITNPTARFQYPQPAPLRDWTDEQNVTDLFERSTDLPVLTASLIFKKNKATSELKLEIPGREPIVIKRTEKFDPYLGYNLYERTFCRKPELGVYGSGQSCYVAYKHKRMKAFNKESERIITSFRKEMLGALKEKINKLD